MNIQELYEIFPDETDSNILDQNFSSSSNEEMGLDFLLDSSTLFQINPTLSYIPSEQSVEYSLSRQVQCGEFI